MAENKSEKKLPRIWVDGCFDMMHFGHANALRQARMLGSSLVVGVHNDADVLKNKGPTVMKEEERYKAVRACKWVDEVVPDAPYVTSLEWMDKYNCDICVHGDDLVTSADGTDCYELVKKAGRFLTVKRTKGISTTDLVGRMLLLTKSHFIKRGEDGTVKIEKKKDVEAFSQTTKVAQYVASTRRIEEFSSGKKEPSADDVIVYVDGAFDLFHIGHIEFLEQAKKLGTYLIVGVYDDQTVNQYQGMNLPIMNCYERTLGVLSCAYVDEVIIGAPLEITKQFVEDLKINKVACGSIPHSYDVNLPQPYQIPKQLGLLVEVKSPSAVTTHIVIDRILENHKIFEERNKKKEAKEKTESGKAHTN